MEWIAGILAIGGFLAGGFGYLSREIHRFRDEFRGEVSTLRGENRTDIGALRDEVRTDIGALRHDLDRTRQELRSDLKELTTRYITHLEHHAR